MRVIRLTDADGSSRNGIELDGETPTFRRVLLMNGSGLKVIRIRKGSTEDRSIIETTTPSIRKAKSHFRRAAKAFGCSAEVARILEIRRVVKRSTTQAAG
jgi:hypothetical protein